MNNKYSEIDFHSFVDNKLSEKGYSLLKITKEVMENRLDDFMQFVNSVRVEYRNVYGWNEESKDYFLRDMVDKWEYSYGIVNQKDEICFLNFSSVYGEMIHYHFAYARPDSRSRGLLKIHHIKLNQVCLDNGFREMDIYCPKNNNG